MGNRSGKAALRSAISRGGVNEHIARCSIAYGGGATLAFTIAIPRRPLCNCLVPPPARLVVSGSRAGV